jgi:hypothetical protein
MLKELKTLTIKTKNVNIKVCKTCWEPDQPQLSLGMYPVNDPQATGLQTDNTSGTNILQDGFPAGGSRIIQWGWAPIGGARANDDGLTPNNLAPVTIVANVTIN